MKIELFVSDDSYYQENLLEELVTDGFCSRLEIVEYDDTLPEKYCVFEYDFYRDTRIIYLNAECVKDEEILTILSDYCNTSLFEDLSDWTHLPKGVKYYSYEE